VCFDKSNSKTEYDKVDLDSVTDAEALLACRAYLQRKNRLGAWKDYQRRKESLRLPSSVGKTVAFESVGYFWENPEELIYLDNDNDEEMEVISEEVGSEGRVVFESTEEDESVITMMLGTTPSAWERSAEFTNFPTSPSRERVRRSNAAKKTWEDPVWRKMWYEKRWGRLRNSSPLVAKQKRLDERVRSIPTSLFQSPELASLTQEEIIDAIRTYVVSNRKRSRAQTKDARIKKKLEREEAIKTGESKMDLFFASNDDKKQAQQKRAERAKRAYQTRLANQNKDREAPESSIRRKPTHDALPTANTPKDALVRILTQLETNQLPLIADVALILKPPKLGRRKEVLRRILSEHFDLRGKCVPAHDPSKKLLFVTQCSVDELGAFVLLNMHERLASDLSSPSHKLR
jgi:hypothetical protein